jgi:hypothetical protein
MRRIDVRHRTLALDAGLYLVFAVFAAASALWSEFSDYRLWGALAVFAYLFGLVQTIVLAVFHRQVRGPASPAGMLGRLLRSRRTPIALVVVVGMVIPLTVLLFRRVSGALWSEQPEVWVIERSATLLLRHGTPYTSFAHLGRTPVVDDYTPYGPAMTVFGLPRALFGAAPPTDARVMFALFSVAVVGLALHLLDWPRVPIRAAQLAIACPLTALTVSVAGDDLPIVALIVLALALLHRREPAWCGAVLAVAVSMKLIASPALIVLAIAVFAAAGRRGLIRFAGAAVGTGALLTVPVFLVDPTSFVEQVIRFPIGLGAAHSPAASPLPGELIANLGPAGHAVALAMMAGAGLAMAVWLIRRPPRLASDAAWRVAVGLGGAIMLAPATRYGYLVYPLVLLGAAITLRALTSNDPEIPEPVWQPAPAAD